MKEIVELFFTFFKIGLFSFGGGYAMIPLIKEEVINIHCWMSESQFVDMLAISQVTPGPIAINIATYLGFQVKGIFGSFIATFAVTLPSIIIMVLLYFLVKAFMDSKYKKWFFDGLKPVVVGLILAGLFSITKSSIFDITTLIIAVGSFYMIYKKDMHPILVIALAAGLGVVVNAI